MCCLTRLDHELNIFSEAAPYLPRDAQSIREGAVKPPLPVPCSFGPFGKQTRLEVNMFDDIKIGKQLVVILSQ